MAKIAVQQKVYDIMEPFVDFGHGKCHIKSFETRGLLRENAGGILYAGQSVKEKELLYAFQDGELKSCILMFNMQELDIASDVARFYAERYRLSGKIGDMYIFEAADQSFSVAVSTNQEMGLHAMYLRNETSSLLH
ncbi:hypothetical protein M8998_08655 [Sphingobacterium sp. lm-10]|uniref:hypothetical protein n=1 Tax=Sphingobacterium sp. lm-10 TaxID=2944904 RepID=UPI002020A7DE|nr:hypothetical protein [Sphingobacterium sp. lm-10]MCL7988007.1 hypothetical protein [Sphingobacterium sp. lm-10]